MPPCKDKPLCASCGPEQLARNNYFTGKLLVERDFTEEQAFFLDKHRRHNRYLHGWGVVCGLRVTAHPNANCRERFVIVEPGIAIDACGNEIVVTDPQCVPIQDLFMERWRAANPDTSLDDDSLEQLPAQQVQLCIRHRECPTEDIPALLDDCADSDYCAPNRIRESFAFDVVLEPRSAASMSGVNLTQLGTFEADWPSDVAYDPNSGAVYVLAANKVRRLRSDGAPTAASFERNGVEAMALAADGRFLFLVQDGSLRRVPVDGPESLVELGTVGHAPGQLKLTVSDDHVFVLSVQTGKVWRAPIEPTPEALVVSVNFDPRPTDPPGAVRAPVVFSASSDGTRLVVGKGTTLYLVQYVRSGSATQRIDVDVVPSAADVRSLGTTFRALGGVDGALMLVTFDTAAPLDVAERRHSLQITGTPIAAAQGTRYGAVLVEHEEQHKLLVIDLPRLGSGDTQAIVYEAELPDKPAYTISMSSDDRYLFVGCDEGADLQPSSWVVLELVHEDCEWRSNSLDCTCDGDMCLVLATFLYGPTTQLFDDAIDNLRDRKVLPSIDDLARAITCLSDCCEGREPLPREPAPQPENPPPPPPAHERLVYIRGINWKHGAEMDREELYDQLKGGLVVGFSEIVWTDDLKAAGAVSVEALVAAEVLATTQRQWIVLAGSLEVGSVSKTGTFEEDDDSATATGLRFLPDDPVLRLLRDSNATIFQVRIFVRGDLIRSAVEAQDGVAHGSSLDLNHIAPWVVSRREPKDLWWTGRTGDGVAGGTFEKLHEHPAGRGGLTMPIMHATTNTACCPACGDSTCNALECMQRPRFFGGQLLTERELNAFMEYTLAKNRLHNRMLHGSGTVCGLRVVEHECPGWIRIEPGYAIDPCGNDIVVCEPYNFDLLKAIREQCARERRDIDCGFRRQQAEPDCLEQNQVWCIALRFDEQSIRPVAPLRRDRKRACKTCGTSGRCGCGTCSSCGAEPQKCSCAPSRAREPIECEPTRIAEGFQVDVCRGEEMCSRPSTKLDGTAFGSLRDSLSQLVRGTPLSHGGHAATPCSVLIPPCPKNGGDKVCLACVRVGSGGKLQICEFSCRTFAGSFPTLNHWLPIGSSLLSALCKLCCSSQADAVHLRSSATNTRAVGPVSASREPASPQELFEATKVAEQIIDALPDAIGRAVRALLEPKALASALATVLKNVEGFYADRKGG